jgi:hypothetical protein
MQDQYRQPLPIHTRLWSISDPIGLLPFAGPTNSENEFLPYSYFALLRTTIRNNSRPQLLICDCAPCFLALSTSRASLSHCSYRNGTHTSLVAAYQQQQQQQQQQQP